ncbi:type II toxin-antitoxin system VapC family toxin [Mesorhizobium sp. CGMCC 1.15528]|uniref:Type II toxin-antitoxin system VapC family toxin n=1 Tax=Mesorhizobium zhangyense TaxID=1776730 RepID=A0A7C9R4P6_9HYPH|nr:type II toxin-antitoxin system VapC family toxin [Mesorhizobium zhangyense]NGN40080.1 type II toxin-antitoxin system VapC family toxin [Mesorhizobium zhangyense]
MIIDASVASHWFVDTEFSKAADPFRALPGLVAPTFLLVETAHVLYKRARAGEIAPEKCGESIELLRDSMSELISDAELLPHALALALKIQHPVYDCLYLALATQRQQPIVTADRRLAALAGTHSIPTELIEPIS